jgi:hypothetical protein
MTEDQKSSTNKTVMFCLTMKLKNKLLHYKTQMRRLKRKQKKQRMQWKLKLRENLTKVLQNPREIRMRVLMKILKRQSMLMLVR